MKPFTPFTHLLKQESSNYLVTAVLTLCTIFVIMGLIGFYQVKGTNLRQEAITRQQQYAKTIAEELKTYLISAQQLAESVSALVAPLRDHRQEVETLLERMLISAPEATIYGIGVWFEPYLFASSNRYFGPYIHRGEDSDDPLVLTYEWTTPAYNFHQQPWYQTGKAAQGQPVFTEPYFDTGLVYMSAAKAFYNQDHQFIGVVTVDMILPLIRDYIMKTNIGQLSLIYLSTKQGALFVHPYEKILLEFSRKSGKQTTTMLDLTLDDLNRFNQQHHLSDWLEVTAKVDYVEWTVHIMIDPNYLWQAVGSLHNMIMSMIVTVSVGWMVTLLILFRLRQQTVTAKQEKLKLEAELLSRKRHEEHLQDINRQLQIQETRLQQFLEAMPVGVCVGLLGDQGEPYYYYMNRKAKGLLCYSANEYQSIPSVYQLYQAGTNQLYPPERLPLLRALAGDSSWVDDLEIHQILHTVPVEVWGSPIFDEQHQVIYAITVFQDITGRKQAEAEREQFTQELFELSSAYERFVPREFLSLLNKQSIRDIQLGDQIEKEMTILFSDIRGFTSLSEKMTPQENFQFINNYLSAMEPIIREHHGFIDKYIGDAIMALFPTADAAVQTAIAMLTSLARYNQANEQQSQPAITVGIGINTGPMMLGTVGGQHRLNGTVISDAVNLASRIEGLTKIYQIHLLITQQTYLHLTDPTQYHIRVMDTVKVKGKSENITIYEVYEADPPEIIAQKTATRDDFEVGFALYHSSQIGDALPHFERVMQVNPHDPPAQIYLDRCYEILGLHLIQAKILVVDDSRVNTEYLFQILQWSQFEVLVAEDGKTALNLAESQQPNLILLDVIIPDMDGFEICQHLKSQAATKQIPIIFMTALTDLEHKMTGFELGAVDYITKPFHREEILARINIHLSNHYLKQRLIEKMAS